MKSIEEEFKEYKISAISKELRRIEELLKDETHWDSSEEAIKEYRALESQRSSLLHLEGSSGDRKVGPYGSNMEIGIQIFSTRKWSREGK